MNTYTCLTGEVLTYPDPAPDVAAFVAEAQRMTGDPAVDYIHMVNFVGSEEKNPLLDRSVIPGRAIVTREVMNNPIYRVLKDLVAVKAVRLGLLDLDKAAQPYTVSVQSAADQLGLTTVEVRAEIDADEIDAIMRNGQWYLRPDSIAHYNASQRGRNLTALGKT